LIFAGRVTVRFISPLMSCRKTQPFEIPIAFEQALAHQHHDVVAPCAADLCHGFLQPTIL
jgi:hypothetical protein